MISLHQFPLYIGVASVLGLTIAGAMALVMHRLYLHPLSAFPGPIFAATTGWYETYYEVYLGGKLVEKLEALHKLYGQQVSVLKFYKNLPEQRHPGPVVRIGPNKVCSFLLWRVNVY